MLWFVFACSSNEMFKAAEESAMMDTGFQSDTAGSAEYDDSVLDTEVQPIWWKLSANIVQDPELDLLEATVWMDVYTEQLDWLCQQEIRYIAEEIESPHTSIETWFQLSEPMIENVTCSVDVPVSLQLGVGELVEDVSVATEVTHWLEGDSNLETEVVWGAYLASQDTDVIWTFGVAFHPNEREWVVRTIYALKY